MTPSDLESRPISSSPRIAPEAPQIGESMESDQGKLFIGGISWETSEDRLQEYFRNYGEVVEAVIMKDRSTGRGRGFGFVVFADPTVAERVVMEKHTIDGRMVEAKKAVPRDDQNLLGRSNSSVHGSPGPTRTRKIFVGGLASTVTEADFKKYFEQFGAITDVVVMYDHNTRRPRGFGFITYDSEDAVDKALLKTFHELNGKMVEVKRAVPKELSPGPNMRSPIGYNYGLNRVNSLLNGYPQGYNPSSISGYPMRMDGRFSPLVSGRTGLPSIGPAYGIEANFEPSLSPSYGGNTNYSNGLSYGRGLSPYYSGNSSRYSSPIGYNGANSNMGSVFSSAARNVWGNGGLSYTTNSATSNAYMNSGSGSLGGIGNNSMIWGTVASPISAHGGGNGSGYGGGNVSGYGGGNGSGYGGGNGSGYGGGNGSGYGGGSLSFGSGDNTFGLGGSSFGRTTGTGPANTTFTTSGSGYQGSYTDVYGSNSVYGDTTWRSASSELDRSIPFGYELGSATLDVTAKGSTGYMGAYNISDREPNRGSYHDGPDRV